MLSPEIEHEINERVKLPLGATSGVLVDTENGVLYVVAQERISSSLRNDLFRTNSLGMTVSNSPDAPGVFVSPEPQAFRALNKIEAFFRRLPKIYGVTLS